MTHRLFVFNEWLDIEASENDDHIELENKIALAYKQKTGIDIEVHAESGSLSMKKGPVICKITYGEVA